jgi:hypothetical protein
MIRLGAELYDTAAGAEIPGGGQYSFEPARQPFSF